MHISSVHPVQQTLKNEVNSDKLVQSTTSTGGGGCDVFETNDVNKRWRISQHTSLLNK